MSFGIPVISTDVGGTREIVNNKNGILLDANPNPIQVALKIDDFISLNKIESKSIRKAAFQTWNNKYSAKLNYNEFVDQVFNL